MTRNPTTALAKRENMQQTARAIDEVASQAMELFKGAGSFERELLLATAMQDLRLMLTPDIMEPIMSIMNTDVGFQTDHNPKNKDDNGKPLVPYSVDVVRDCFIESRLRGFRCVGNEWNILVGRFYAAKAGFRRRLTDGTTFPGLSGLKDSYDVPRNVADKGAIVKCRAEWTFNGKPDSLEAEIPIKVNSYMGADAILGKAERKLMKRVHDRLAGVTTPDGEEQGEVIDVTSRKVPPEPQVKVKPRPPTDEGAQSASVAPTPPEPTDTPAGSAKAQEQPPTDPQAPAEDPRARLILVQLRRDGYAMPQAMSALGRMFPETTSCADLSEVARAFPNVINAVLRSWDGFKRVLSEGKPPASADPNEQTELDPAQ